MKYLIIALLFLACKPYNQIAKKPPLSDRDTLNLSKRCMEVFPVVPKIVIVEKTDTVMDQEAVINLSKKLTTALKQLDECKDSKGNLVNLDSFKTAITKEVEKDCKPVTIVKTVTKEITIPDTVQAVYWRKTSEALTKESAVKDGQIKELKEQITEAKQKKRQYQWSFYGLIGLVALYILGRIKRVIP